MYVCVYIYMSLTSLPILHQQDESFVALRCVCLAEDAEYQEVYFTWPGQRRNFYAKINIKYVFVLTEELVTSGPHVETA